MKKSTLITAVVSIMLLTLPAWAQQGPQDGYGPPPGMGQGPPPGMGQGPPPGMEDGPPPGMDSGLQQSIKRYLYPLHMVRQFATELELTDVQIEKLHKVTSDIQTEVERLMWDLTGQTRKLTELIRDGVTKEQIYAQLEEIFKYENKIKKKKMGLLIVVRDILTAEQREYLDQVKESHLNQKKWQKKMKTQKMKKGKK